ncbi:unnamed protein product [Dovyalis caffra]|uniref:Uncharacterized protein n=1 Tax=Dovyalis caffra TaxID=77055 RepID=A0AAV1ST14_9ROSI|nr:unnamed protein product [Dovyalis caffra]
MDSVNTREAALELKMSVDRVALETSRISSLASLFANTNVDAIDNPLSSSSEKEFDLPTIEYSLLLFTASTVTYGIAVLGSFIGILEVPVHKGQHQALVCTSLIQSI